MEDYKFFREENASNYQGNSTFRPTVDEIDSIISNSQQNDLDMVEITDDESESDSFVGHVDTNNVLPPTVHFTTTDDLYLQISEQIEKMSNATLSNSDRTERMQYGLIEGGNDPHWLELAKIAGDGSCLFGAITHQLFGYKINSDEHVQATRQLRQNVVHYISEHLSTFEGALLDQVSDHSDLSQMEDFRRACQIFVNDYLSRDNVWGGQETIQAAQEMFSVNILVFREPNSYNYVHRFDEPNTRILLLAYRLGSTSNPLSHNHYDSVCNIDTDETWNLAQFLSEKHLSNQ